MAGLDPVLGFVRRTAEDINEQLAADEIAGISPALDTSSTSPMGQVNSAVTKVVAELWDALEAVYNSQDPDKATGDGQDALCALTGTTREAAARSQVRCALNLNIGANIPVGALIAVLGNDSAQFKLVGTETIPGTVNPGNVLALATDTYYARFESVDTGPIAANAGTLTRIVTPQTGWNTVSNPLDAVLGRNVEEPAELRIRREVELAAAGSTPVDALRAELSELLAAEGVIDGFADVLENVQDVTDADGRPPHSLECLIDDGVSPVDNVLIAQTIWDGRAGGIQTFGSTGADATDALGRARTQYFNRPTPVDIYFALSIVVDTDFFPADGDTLIKEAMVALGATLKPGADVMRTQFFGPIFGIKGVLNCTALTLGTAPAPVGTADISIGVRSRAKFDTSRITITHV